MIKHIIYISVVVFSLTSITGCAQQNSSDYLKKRWKDVATKMPDEWYGSEEAKQVAENVLISQKEIGGWAKNKPYHHELSEAEKEKYIQEKPETGATFDNDATITELRFLAKVYSHIPDARYKKAFNKGLDYIFMAQYENGGWPQFFPVKEADAEMKLDHTKAYSMHITYNDNAMVNTMNFLKEIFTNNKAFETLDISNGKKEKAKEAFDEGVECILNTQIIVDNKPTVWCAQHHFKTLEPVKARSYELPSFSGSESVGIVQLLMEIDQPSKEVIASVSGAVQWFESHKIGGIKIEREKQPDGKMNRVVVKDKNAPPMWGRFYDLDTEKVFFCDRDGIKKNSLAEIGYERRNGYSWYTTAPQSVLDEYPEWLKKIK